MYEANVKVVGVSPLLQHRYPMPDFVNETKGGTRVTGARDYSDEWRGHLYANGVGVYQPGTHFESCMIKAATNYKITGKRGATYKELFKAAVFVDPEEIPFGIPVPETLDMDGDKPLYLDVRPVVVQRARIVRIRPSFKAGWELSFNIKCIDDQIAPQLLQEILTLAGKTVGIGDYRPKFGRFTVARFEVNK